MGSPSDTPTTQLVAPSVPIKGTPVITTKNPIPPVAPACVGIPLRYESRQRVRFDGSFPLHGTEVNRTYRCLVLTDDGRPPPISEMSKILRVIEYDSDGCALLPYLDPNQQHFSTFAQVLSINRLSWRDDPSIPQKFQQAIRFPKWKESVCKEQSNVKNHFTFSIEKNVGKPKVPTMWIFEIKDDGMCKSRLVGRGDLMRERSIMIHTAVTLVRQVSRSR